MNAPLAAPALHIKGSVREQVGEAEWEARVNLAACYRLIALEGLTEMIANHISVRIPGRHDQFLLNPYGMLYEEMTASSMIRVDLDGTVLFNQTEYEVNRAGWVIHSCIHAARHDVDAVLHTHSLAGMAVSAMECGILPIAQSSMRFAEIAYHDYEGVALRTEEQARLVASLGHREAMVLRNHGLLTVGASIPQCFNNMYRLERACQLQVMTLSCNTPLRMPSDESVAYAHSVYAKGLKRPFGELEWPALLRKLDKLDPSFRD
jgi:ribulose-5-phosphate 4-epimerase/fuculose-1-phosphate aldolase